MSRRRAHGRASLATDERGLTRFGAGFVFLVGLSGATMALQGGASPSVVGVSMVGCTVVGAALLWYLRRIGGELERSGRRL